MCILIGALNVWARARYIPCIALRISVLGALNVWHVCVHAALEPDCYMRGRGAAEDGCDSADAGAFSYDLVFSLLVAFRWWGCSRRL